MHFWLAYFCQGYAMREVSCWYVLIGYLIQRTNFCPQRCEKQLCISNNSTLIIQITDIVPICEFEILHRQSNVVAMIELVIPRHNECFPKMLRTPVEEVSPHHILVPQVRHVPR